MSPSQSSESRAGRPGVPQGIGARTPITTVHGSPKEGATAVALEIADLVERRPDAVLGLATGGTMVGVYAAFVQEAQRRGLDVTGIRTFNLDEYLGLSLGDERRFRHFMDVHLFGPLGVPPEHTHFPDGERALLDGVGAAREYEAAIEAAGGIELQLLGIGRNGHIAFNEPGSSPDSRTRVVELHGATRADAAAAFGGVDETPSRAITMGMGTILEARALRVLAFGSSKAPVVERMLRGPEDPQAPCTFLRGRHSDLSVHLDLDAARLLH